MDLSIVNGLNKESLQDIALLGFFENYPVEKVFRVHDSILLLGKSDHLWTYISCNSIDELTGLLQISGINTKYYASIEEWMEPVIIKNAEVEWSLSTIRYVLPDNQEVDPPDKKTITLDKAAVNYIYNHSDYRKFTSKEYIKERIERGISAGLMEGGQLVAWALSHDDNSLGFLHVLPEFRRKGYGKEISKAMILQKRKENKPVFVNIEPANINSINLVNSMGFVPDRKISWLKLK